MCTFDTAGKIMLQDAKEEVICKLSEASGRDIPILDMGTLQAGSIVQITTESNSIYLLEITHEHSEWVYFARYTHKDLRRAGRYFGKQKLGSLIIAVGETMTHDNMTTKPVTKITLLCE